MARIIPDECDTSMKGEISKREKSLPGDQESDSNTCFQQVSKSSLSALPESFDPSLDPTILRTLSSSPLQMTRNPSDRSIDCLPQESLDASFPAPESSIPRRNLTEAFEELYTKPSTALDTPVVKQTIANNDKPNMISPTGVAEIDAELAKVSAEPIPLKASLVTPDKEEREHSIPHFELHTELKRELSEALVDRVSFYAVIHDINKEATAMASNDDAGYHRNPEDLQEQFDPLIVAVNGLPDEPMPEPSSIKVALIDEERWLLDTIDSRSSEETRSIKACPPTFLQAMGERDYENPLTSLSNGSRTQLWKPSRSWWEAKSGKNPWIEPKSHNKRWRYLWPLIHYHKFLAKCIKKLKRNGVDVKTSVSPVSVFLREEVCAVSDHLASVSLFDSEEWMACLEYFTGWTDADPASEERIRSLVSNLRLRPMCEPGDVDSPLLRSQIDEQYLRAMATARAQMVGTGIEERRSDRESGNRSHQTPDGRSKKSNGHPPTYPKSNSSKGNGSSSNASGASPVDRRRPQWGYPHQPPHWWGGGWHPHPAYHYADDGSVQSGLSGDSYPQPYDMAMYPAAMHPHYYPPMMYPPQPQPHGQPMPYDATQDPRMYSVEGYMHDQYNGMQWAGNPVPVQTAEENPSSPKTPSASNPNEEEEETAAEGEVSAQGEEPQVADQTPYKYNPGSPYWGHLDHTTLAMMGIASPQGMATPQTPMRGPPSPDGATATEDANGAVVNAQPLLLRQQYPTYGYYGNREGYAPPSPATQFMMSPQANFAYGYGPYGGYSPAHGSPSRQFSPSPKKKSGKESASKTPSPKKSSGKPPIPSPQNKA